MKRILSAISAFFQLLGNGVKRFYTCTLFTLILFGTTYYITYWENTNDSFKAPARAIFVCILGFFISALFTLVVEKLNQNTKIMKIINTAVSLLASALYFFFIFTDVDNKYQGATLAGIVIALAAIAFYFANKTSNEKFSVHFSYLVKALFISAIVALVVMLGLFLCIAAVYFLIYKFDDAYKFYMVIASFCWSVLFVNLFMAQLPREEEDYKIPKFFKIITLYTALPVYLGLILILYIYLGKIIVTLQFPSGQLNWFASFASLIGIFLFLAIRQYYYQNSFVKWYVKLFGYILLPVIVMQCVAVGIRLSNYGLTPARYISAVLIDIAIITAVVSLMKKGKYIPFVLFLVAFCSIITTTGFLNLYDVPLYEQEARLTNVLKAQSMLNENGKIVPNPNIDVESKEKISSAYQYLASQEMSKSKLLKDYYTEDIPFEQIFGFDKVLHGEGEYGFNHLKVFINYKPEDIQTNIDGYQNLLNINSSINVVRYNVVKLDHNGIEYVFDMNKFIRDLYETYDNTEILPQDKLMIEQDNKKLIITNISFYVDKDKNNAIEINHLEGYILKK